MQTNHVFIESSIIIPYLFPSNFLMNLSFLEFQVMRADKSILLTHMLATYIIMNTPATQTLLLFLKAAWEEGYLWMRAHMYTYMHMWPGSYLKWSGERWGRSFPARLLSTALQTELGCLWRYNHGPKQVSGTAGGQIDFLESDNSRKAGWRRETVMTLDGKYV